MIEYRDFQMGKLFNFKAIKQAKSQSLIPSDDKGVSYIVQSRNNNMYSRRVDRDWLISHSESPVAGNAIVLGVTLPCVSYQPDEFGASQVITARADFLNEYTGLYIVCVLEKYIKRFSYSQKPGLQIYREMKISLPIQTDDSGNPLIDLTHFYHDEGYIPDWEYMQERIAELEAERIAELKQYLVATGLNDYELTEEDKKVLSLSEKRASDEDRCDADDAGIRFKEFKVSDLFKVEGTKSLDAGSLTFVENGINFIGRTDDNNGIQGKIVEQSFVSNAPNTITVTVIGDYKYAKLQEEPYYCSQNINKLTPLFDMSRKVGIYMRAGLQKFASQYDGEQGGYKLYELKNHMLALPIQFNMNGTPIIDSEFKYHPDGYIPDWDYMERYIRAIEKVVIADTVKWKDEMIDTTKKIVEN